VDLHQHVTVAYDRFGDVGFLEGFLVFGDNKCAHVAVLLY
jgi:hypothetical protein